ncbi:hypothetical protein CEN49_06380 [Fischerella thermalis CCMEE 5273]|nr:hypothetical protein CEN49_06380 [Fischerella thermalis CCMEE 5273]
MVVVGRYDQSIKRLMQTRIQHLGQAYIRTSFAGYILCIFLFFAAIPLVYRVVKKQLIHINEQVRHSFASRAILRAFALATIWSPIEVFIAITLGFTGVGFGQLLPWLLLFSISLLLLDWFLGVVRYRSVRVEQRGDVTMQPRDWKRIVALVVGLTLLILLNLGVQQVTGIPFFAAMTLSIVPFAACWAWVSGRFASFIRYCRLRWTSQTLGLQNFMLLFLSLGFFNESLTASSWFSYLQSPVTMLAQFPLMLFLILQLSSLVLTFVGIHPLVTIGIQGVLIQPLLTELNPLSLAIVLLTANLATDAAGTFNTTVTMMSDLTRNNPYRITGWNLGFALLYGGIGVALALLLL